MKKSQGPSLSVAAKRGGFIVTIRGVLDDRFDGAAVQSLSGPVVFDIDGVTRITSSGVRKWLEMLRSLQTVSYCFVGCRPAIVSQFNLVRGFGGAGVIVTLYAPYVCEQCGEEINQLLDLRRQHAHLAEIADAGVPCPSCGGVARFDDYAPDYFECVASVPPPSLPMPLAAVLDGDAHLKVVKDVTPTFTALWLSGVVEGTTQFKRVADGLEGLVLVVLHDLANVTEPGYQALARLTNVEDVTLALARVPLRIARGLVASNALGRARIASVVVATECASCTRVDELEIDEAKLDVFRSEPPARICPCGAALAPLEDALEIAKDLPWTSLADDATTYLAERLSARLEATSETLPSMAANTPPIPVGTMITASPKSRRYELLERIASGGMGVVYLGRVLGAGGFERLVAIKHIHPHLAENAQFVAMFLDEARFAARIHHPNVVSTHDVEHGPDGLFLVMDYIEGVSAEHVVATAVASRTPTPVSVTVRILLDLLAGLHAAHELTDANGEPLRLVHRDVSPGNVLVGADGITRLGDFGIAHTDRRLAVTTEPGALKGKIGYMSPEQISEAPVDRRSDVYAAGVVAWELLTGTWLFGDESGRGILREALEGPKRVPSEVNPAVPAGLSAVCMTALSRHAAARHPSAAAFAEQIERACRAASIAIAPAAEVADVVRSIAGPHLTRAVRGTPARSAS